MNIIVKTLTACAVLSMVSFAAVAAEQATTVHIEKKFDGQCKNLTEPQIVAIQQSLASRGFYQGQLNGVWNVATLEAVKSYQVSRSLAPTGILMTTDLEALGLDVSGLRYEFTTTEKIDIRKHGNGPNARGAQSFME